MSRHEHILTRGEIERESPILGNFVLCWENEPRSARCGDGSQAISDRRVNIEDVLIGVSRMVIVYTALRNEKVRLGTSCFIRGNI